MLTSTSWGFAFLEACAVMKSETYLFDLGRWVCADIGSIFASLSAEPELTLCCREILDKPCGIHNALPHHQYSTSRLPPWSLTSILPNFSLISANALATLSSDETSHPTGMTSSSPLPNCPDSSAGFRRYVVRSISNVREGRRCTEFRDHFFAGLSCVFSFKIKDRYLRCAAT